MADKHPQGKQKSIKYLISSPKSESPDPFFEGHSFVQLSWPQTNMTTNLTAGRNRNMQAISQAFFSPGAC